MLIHTERLEEILKSAILSAKVSRSDVSPVCIFLVAPPERGKTSVALSVADTSLVLTDCSAVGLLETLKANPMATHIILTDLMSVSGHREQVKQLTISVLNALAEEGTYKIAMPNMAHLDLGGRRVGIIACTTPNQLTDQRVWWVRSGFASRLLILEYDHAPSLVMQILQSIARHDGKVKPSQKKLPLPEKCVHVQIAPREAQDIMSLALHLSKRNQELGYRKQKQLRSLACGHALMPGRSWHNAKVNRADVEWLHSIAVFMNGDENGQVAKLQ